LNENYTSAQQSHFSSSEVSSHLSTGLFDYFYKSSFEENKAIPVVLGRKLSCNKISIANNFSVYESENNNRYLSLNFDCNNDPRNHESEISYGLDLHQKLLLPFNLTLFDQNFVDNKISLERSISSSHSDLTLKKSFTIYNFLRFPVNLGISPSFALFEKNVTGLDINFDYAPFNNLSTSTKIDPIHKTFDFTVNYKRKKEKIISFLNLGKDRFSLGGFYFQNISSKLAKSNSVFIKQNGIYCSNESIIHFKQLAFRFTSNINLTKNENNLNINSSLVLGLQFGTFKVQFPIAISKESNYLSHSLILLSSLLGNIFLSIRRRWSKKKASEHVSILNKLNRNKLMEFITKNLQTFYNKNQLEKANNGLVINFAFLGEYSKILYIYKSLQLFGIYVNDDNKVFDVKLPLTLHMVNSKIDVPAHFNEIEGIYVPDYENRENLAMVIMYTWNYSKTTVLLKNDRAPFSLP
jgi:hypothetical protein